MTTTTMTRDRNETDKRDVQYYLSLPYAVSLRRDTDGDVIACIPDLPGCVTHAETEVTALAAIRDVQKAWLERAIKSGIAIPLPSPAEEELPSGKWLQRVPRTLHQKLTAVAKVERVSLNQLVTTLLAQAVGQVSTEQEAVNALQTAADELREAIRCAWPVIRHSTMGSTLLAWEAPQQAQEVTAGMSIEASSVTYLQLLSSQLPHGRSEVQEQYDYCGIAGLRGFPQERSTNLCLADFKRSKTGSIGHGKGGRERARR